MHLAGTLQIGWREGQGRVWASLAAPAELAARGRRERRVQQVGAAGALTRCRKDRKPQPRVEHVMPARPP